MKSWFVPICNKLSVNLTNSPQIHGVHAQRDLRGYWNVSWVPHPTMAVASSSSLLQLICKLAKFMVFETPQSFINCHVSGSYPSLVINYMIAGREEHKLTSFYIWHQYSYLKLATSTGRESLWADLLICLRCRDEMLWKSILIPEKDPLGSVLRIHIYKHILNCPH